MAGTCAPEAPADRHHGGMTEMSALRFVERAPSARLRSVVNRLWLISGPAPQRTERILPLPFVHLIVNLGDPYRVLEQGAERPGLLLTGAFLSGLQTAHLVNENPAFLHHVGAEIRPHALAALTAVPPREVAERVRDAEPVLPGVERLRAVLVRASDPEDAIDPLERFLLSSLRPGWTPDSRVEAALARMAAQPDRPIASLATEAGVSHQTLIAEFVRTCGITPKKLAEVYRHVAFLAAIPPVPPLPTWAELAASAGYYDQPHFIRSFARLTGLTPRRYLQLRRATAGEDSASFLSEDGR